MRPLSPRMEHGQSDQSLLLAQIKQWNADHYDIFELSPPNQDLEFHGVVRFFFQGGVGASVITKCIRVSSTATTREVIEVLVEKFRPDMRMLSQHKYALYEVHVNGEERQLALDEKPLLVQLGWGKDVREGRFLLRQEDHSMVKDSTLGFGKSIQQHDQSVYKRKMSRRDMKEKRKRDKERGKENLAGEDSVAGKLYQDAPETSLTRSISNPESVMRRRRQQTLERKLVQMSAENGHSDSGGTLKIYGEAVCPGVPYKTLFLSTADPVSVVIREAMDKYGLERDDPNQYCLVEVMLPSGDLEFHDQKTRRLERTLEEDECPLAIVVQHEKHRGHVIFQLRKKSTVVGNTQKTHSLSEDMGQQHDDDDNDGQLRKLGGLPYLLEVSVSGQRPPVQHVLPLNVTEVVRAAPDIATSKSDFTGKHYLQLSGPDVCPRHCVITHIDGIVTLTPINQNAETYVDGHRIYETTILKHGMTIQFGRDRIYRFLHPSFHEQPYQTANRNQQQPAENNFHVENTTRLHSPWMLHQMRDISRQLPGSPIAPHDLDDLLPASVEFALGAMDRVIQACTVDVNIADMYFRLTPTYCLYMTVRQLLSLVSPLGGGGQVLARFLKRTAQLIQDSIQTHHHDPTAAAFWMTNCSEILHMFKHDRDLQKVSGQFQESLAEAVQMAFHHLVQGLQNDLLNEMPAFLKPSDSVDRLDDPNPQHLGGPASLSSLLDTLSAVMSLLRRSQANAALTIQLFSQLFHFINTWLFNMLVTQPQLQLCTRAWGQCLKRRLGHVAAWAEQQGLELAADCHLCRIIQAAHLLQAPKATSDDITNISSTCFKLNSLQLRSLLTQYLPEPHEPPVSVAFIERVASIAENMADELTRAQGGEVRLLEDSDLHLPFLLPEDGYFCETIRGIPNGLPEFVQSLEDMGICRLIINASAEGSWTVYMESGGSDNGQIWAPGYSLLHATPEVTTISFNKIHGSMGLSIVAAQPEGSEEQGIYIKSVVDGGAAAVDGRLQAGDQLLAVDGKSLIGVSQNRAAELMTTSSQLVQLTVAKQAAFYHNLGPLLSQPSPTGPRRKDSITYGNSERTQTPPINHAVDLGPAVYNEPVHYEHSNGQPQSASQPHMDTSRDHGPMHSVSLLQHHHPAADNQTSTTGSHPDLRNGGYQNRSHAPGIIRGQTFHMGQNYRAADLGQGRSISGHRHHQTDLSHRVSDRSLDRSSSSRNSSVIGRDSRPLSAYADVHGVIARDRFQTASLRPVSEDVGWRLHDRSEGLQGRYGHVNGGNSPPPYRRIEAPNRDLSAQLTYSLPPPPEPTHKPPLQPIYSIPPPIHNPPSQPTHNVPQPIHRPPSQPFHNIPQPIHSRPSQPTHNIPQPIHSPPPQPTAHTLMLNQQSLPQKLRTVGISRQQNHSSENNSKIHQAPAFSHHTQQQPGQTDHKVATESVVRMDSGRSSDVPQSGRWSNPQGVQQAERRFSQPELRADSMTVQVSIPEMNTQSMPRYKTRRQVSQNLSDLRNADHYSEQNHALDRQLHTSFHQDGRPPSQDENLQEHPSADTSNHFGYTKEQLGSSGQPSGHSLNPHGLPPEDPTPPPVPPPPSDDHILEWAPTGELKLQVSAARNLTAIDPRHQMSQAGTQNHLSVPAQVATRGQGHQVEQAASVSNSHTRVGNSTKNKPAQNRVRSYTSNTSAWDREARERAQEEKQEELFRAREREIADLESRQQLSPQERERLARLKTEYEFQRRVREIAEKGDYEYEDDEDFAERLYNRERLIEMVTADLEKSQQRLREFDLAQQKEHMAQELERQETLKRRLEMYENDREEHKLRMQRKQEKQIKEHQEQIRLQKETKQRQRERYQEYKQRLIAEEEKLNQRREEELNKRRQFERERRQEIQDQLDEEEKKIRESLRRIDKEQMQLQLAKNQQLQLHNNRPIHVTEEKQRLESIISSNHGQSSEVQKDIGHSRYLPYASDSRQKSVDPAMLAPPPPERQSSRDKVMRVSAVGSFSERWPELTHGSIP